MSNDSMSNAERRVRTGQTIRVVIWLIVVAAIVVFALVNTEKTPVDWVFGDTNAPLWTVIGVSAVAGVILGLLIGLHRRSVR
jgi:uncharacterized integral membrane protein